MTKREILLIKTGGVTVVCAMVLAIATVFLVKYAWPEVKFEQPADPSTQNLKSVGIALMMYAEDLGELSLPEDSSFPVLDKNERRIYTGPSEPGNVDTGSNRRTDNKDGDPNEVP